MTTQLAQPAKNGLKTGILVLAAVALICASFLIGRFVANSSDDGTRQSSQDTSQVSEEDANEELDSSEPETVFDSTEEEIEEVKEEQEKIEQETEQKVETVRKELSQSTDEGKTKISAGEYANFQLPQAQCSLSILYGSESDVPTQSQLGSVALGDTGSQVGCQLTVRADGSLQLEPGNKNELESDFSIDTYKKITKVSKYQDTRGVQYYLNMEGYSGVIYLYKGFAYQGNYIIDVVANDQPVKQAVTTETYTNRYFPDFKLVYPSDWKFSTQTETSYFSPQLLDREITLTKGDMTLVLDLRPVTSQDRFYRCNPVGPVDYEVQTELSGGIKEYTMLSGARRERALQSNTLLYAFDGDEACGYDEITTTIKESDIKGSVPIDDDEDNNLTYKVNARLELPQNGNPSNQANLEEARAILENSTIR